MTRSLPFTKAGLRRRVEAARESGLHVINILPDGTLVVRDGPQAPGVAPEAGLDGRAARTSKWEDQEA